MPKRLPATPNLEQLKKQAKDLLKLRKTKDLRSIKILSNLRRFGSVDPELIASAEIKLSEAQFALALEYGAKDWKSLKEHVKTRMETGMPKQDNQKSHLETFDEITKLDDYSIQFVLREIDTLSLALAMANAPQAVHDCIYRNMSSRAAEMIKEDLLYMRPPEHLTKGAQETVVATVNKAIDQGYLLYDEKRVALQKKKVESMQAPHKKKIAEIRKLYEPVIKGKPTGQRSAKEMIPLLKVMAAIDRRYGTLALEELVEKIDDAFLADGIRLVVDGVNPRRLLEILEAKRDSLIADYTRRLNIIVTAVKAIQMGENPRLIEAECKAMLPAEI